MIDITEMTKSEKEELKNLIKQVKILFKSVCTRKRQGKFEVSQEDKSLLRHFLPPLLLENTNNCFLSLGSFYCEYNTCIPFIFKLIKTYAEESIENKIHEMNEIRYAEECYSPKESNKTKQTQIGWIYFLQADNNTTKIGKTTRPQKIRIKELEALLPYETYLLSWVEVTNVHQTETNVHNFYKEYRINNTEWFRLPAQEIESIKKNIFPVILENCRT